MTKDSTRAFYGWKLIATLCLIHFMVIGFCFYGPAVLYPHMIRDLQWSRTEISLGFMVAILVMGLSSPIAAWCVSRFSPKKSLVGGALVGALGMYLTQFADNVYYYLFSFGLLVGVGWCFSAVIPVQTLVTYWFHKRRGLAFGLVWSGGAIGGLVGPSAVTSLVQYFDNSWQSGWCLLSVLMVVSALLGAALIRNRPEELGQQIDGISVEHSSGTNKVTVQPPASVRPHPVRFFKLLKTSQFWLLVACIVGNVFGWQIILTQSPLHLADRGFSESQYSIIYGLTVGLTFIGSLGTGALSDRFDPRKIIIGTSVLGLIGSILFWFVTPNNWIALSYPVLTAISIGANAVVPPIFIGKYWDVSSFARISGYMLPITTIFNSTAPPLAGAIFDSTGNYFYAMVLSWVMFLIAILAMTLIRPPKN